MKLAYGALFFLLVLSACGGGGGSSTPAPSLPVPGGSASPGAPPSPAAGLWKGSTADGRAIATLVLDDGRYYLLYSAAGSAGTLGGAIEGRSTAAGGTFASSDARDFNLEGRGTLAVTLAGSYAAKSSLSATVSRPAGPSMSFTTGYDASFEQPASLSAAAGIYAGAAGSSTGSEAAAFTLLSDGTLTGMVTPACLFSGTLTPHQTFNVFSLSLTFLGGLCTFGSSTLTGIAYYDASTKALYAIAPNAARTEGFMMGGLKPQ